MERKPMVGITGKLEFDLFNMFERLIRVRRENGDLVTKSTYITSIMTLLLKKINSIPLDEDDKIWDEVIENLYVKNPNLDVKINGDSYIKVDN